MDTNEENMLYMGKDFGVGEGAFSNWIAFQEPSAVISVRTSDWR